MVAPGAGRDKPLSAGAGTAVGDATIPPVGALIPLLLALLAVQLHRGQPVPDPSWTKMLAVAGVVVGLWFLAAEAAAQVVLWRRDRRWIGYWENAAQGLILGLFLWLCWGEGWAAWAPGMTAAIAPWLIMQLALWWTLAPALRQLTGSGWSRGGLLLHHLRFELLPVLIALPVLDLCEVIGARLGTLAWFAGPDGILLQLIGGCLLVFAFMALLPSLIIPLWGAKPLADSPLATALQADCARAGLADVRLRVWDSPGGMVFNALALGIVPGMRWVLVSRDLLADLPPDQIRAVVGHELGHHRHRHLVTYLWFALAVNSALWFAMKILVGTADPAGRPLFGPSADLHAGLLFSLPGMTSANPMAVVWTTGAALVLLAWRGLFGVVSRACEREADIHGAALAGPEHMAAALRTVARSSGTPEDAASWRHRPIAARMAFLAALMREPSLAATHRMIVRDMRLLIIASLALLATIGASMWLDPRREARSASDPAAELRAWGERDPQLGEALAQADRGERTPLISWLSRVDDLTRSRFAEYQLREALVGSGKGGTSPPPSDQALWSRRHRFAALSAVNLPDPEQVLRIDNTLAYCLVACTATPMPKDVELARSVLPRLEAAMSKEPHHVIWDTIGCVRFVSGDFDGARRAFEDAVRLAEKERSLGDEKSKEELKDGLRLYQRRLEAARLNLQSATGSKPAARATLPLSFPENSIP